MCGRPFRPAFLCRAVIRLPRSPLYGHAFGDSSAVVCEDTQGAVPDRAASPARRPARRRPPVPRRGRCARGRRAARTARRLGGGVVVLTVGDELPAWVPERLRDMVLTPAGEGTRVPVGLSPGSGTVLACLDAATGPTTTRTSQALRANPLDVEPPVVAALLRPRLAEPDAATARGQPPRQLVPVCRRSRCRPRSRRAALRHCRSSSSSRSSSSDPGSRRPRCSFRLRRPFPAAARRPRRRTRRVPLSRWGSGARWGPRTPAGVSTAPARWCSAGPSLVTRIGLRSPVQRHQSPERGTLSGTDSPDPASGWSPAPRQAHR